MFSKILISFVMLLIFMTNMTWADTLDVRQQFTELHKSITRGQIELTKETHSKYWELLEQSFPGSAEEVIQQFKEMRNDFGKQFQLETWKSAKLSNENKTMTKTKSFKALESSFNHKMAIMSGLQENTEEYKAYVEEKRLNKHSALLNAIKIIEASVNSSLFISTDGSEISMTKETINTVLNCFQQTKIIINKLFNKNWSNQ